MSQISLENYLDQQKLFYDDHVKYHPANVFCSTAGEAETQHIQELLDGLSDREVIRLVARAGFSNYVSDQEDVAAGRKLSEAVVDELDRKDFYREYAVILCERTA